MERNHLIRLIQQIARTPNAFDVLESALDSLSLDALTTHLLECGVIPEVFKHDSSEEKLWAKYCDILLAKAFNHLGIRAKVLRTRGDSADVFGETNEYTIVGDAKAFRLSRTAKNQKDFKVSALDAWRRADTFACLVSPLYQYPSKNSQIYLQAVQRNVVLLSYVHLCFLIFHPPNSSLASVWNLPGSLSPSSSAHSYWQSLESSILQLNHASAEQLEEIKKLEVERTRKIGIECIDYWESVIRGYQSLSQQEAVRKLIEAEKIEEKIRTIKRAILWEMQE